MPRAACSAPLSTARTWSSNSASDVPDSGRGGMLISTLNWPSSVWKSGLAIAARTSSLRITGSPCSSTRLSSISQPIVWRDVSKRASRSMRANTSRLWRTFWR